VLYCKVNVKKMSALPHRKGTLYIRIILIVITLGLARRVPLLPSAFAHCFILKRATAHAWACLITREHTHTIVHAHGQLLSCFTALGSSCSCYRRKVDVGFSAALHPPPLEQAEEFIWIRAFGRINYIQVPQCVALQQST
jgi:hypothetical protein